MHAVHCDQEAACVCEFETTWLNVLSQARYLIHSTHTGQSLPHGEKHTPDKEDSNLQYIWFFYPYTRMFI